MSASAHRVAPALIAAGAALLFWNLGRPLLWQDEAETALRAESILDTGLPRLRVRGVLATAQPSLAPNEAREGGVWIWDTWLPAYLCAASFGAFGAGPGAARLPFALAGLAALWLWWRIFDAERRRGPDWAPEAALAFLALSPAYLLFCRQSRYYALLALGNALVLLAWRALLRGRRGSVWAVALALNFLLHASFGFFAAAGLALALDAALRGRECLRPRFAAAAALSLGLAAPAIVYFRVWERPGNHAYGPAESLEFLKTFLLWLAAFAAPLAVAAAARARRGLVVAAGFVLLCGLVAEGGASRLCAAAALAGVLIAAWRAPAPEGDLGLRRMAWLLIASTLALLSLGAAEPYGRYLVGILPACAYLVGTDAAALSRGRGWAVAALCAATLSSNLLFWAPLKAAQAFAAPASAVDSVSGMMRRRLRDLSFRCDLAGLAGETARGARGYLEPAVAAIKAGGGRTFFSDADQLSLMFATGLRPVYPDDFLKTEPDWLLPSPWLALQPELARRVEELVESGRYAPAGVFAPRILWQNNPDPLYRVWRPASGPLALYRRVAGPNRLFTRD